MQTDFSKWQDELTYPQIIQILQKEFNRQESVKKYFHSDKGKAKRKELNRKYYLMRKAMKELDA